MGQCHKYIEYEDVPMYCINLFFDTKVSLLRARIKRAAPSVGTKVAKYGHVFFSENTIEDDIIRSILPRI